MDGVVCEAIPNEEADRFAAAVPIPGAIETINAWYDEGHYICFFTARRAEHQAVTEDWLRRHGVRFHQVLCGKPRGGNYHYIDDLPVRATRFKGRFTPLVPQTREILVFDDPEGPAGGPEEAG